MSSNRTVLMLFSNGNTAFFKGGEQVPELQESWLKIVLRDLQSKGVNIHLIDEILMPDGTEAKLIKLDNDDFNWELYN